MKTWILQHDYALRVALRRLRKQPWSALTNMLVVALSLMLPLLGASVLYSAQPVFKQLALDPQITLFLQHDTHAEQLDRVAQRLQSGYGDVIATLRTVPRDQALRLLQQNPAWSDALAVLPDNPLPDAIVLTLRRETDTAQLPEANRLVAQWKAWEEVDAVQLDSAWIQRLQAMLETLQQGLGLLGLAVLMVVLATVFNTVRMQALDQRTEIEVARLLGATESFVRRPFLYLGAFSGLVSSLFALLATALALNPLNTALGRLTTTYDSAFVLRLPPASVLLLTFTVVMTLSAASARWSVAHTTRF